ncbi:MAG TPA: hypothetical protein DCY74_00990 [Clostridiales bacterium]|jgi:hypothetical protein|nr:hypothetical protein [Clostridiales bacterium]
MSRFNQHIDLSPFYRKYTVIYLEPSYDDLTNHAVYSRLEELTHLFNKELDDLMFKLGFRKE